jgi:hypothetical protein
VSFLASDDDSEEVLLSVVDNKFSIKEIYKHKKISALFLKIALEESSIYSLSISGELKIIYHRTPTNEEMEFATVADQIPWLENKLINFSYFLDHHIINASQYNKLMNLLQNKLRKANAKLLLYSQLYYQALQNKTKLLGDLSAKIDLVGATFKADLANPYQRDGLVKQTTDFVLAMGDLFANSNESVGLIEYYNTISDYVNKYFNAEQSFLKNMYLFQDYFNTKTDINSLYEYIFTIKEQKNTEGKKQDYQIAFFALGSYVQLTANNAYYPIYIKKDQSYIPYNSNLLLSKQNYLSGDFYYMDSDAKDKIRIDKNSEGYYSDCVYFEIQ